MFAALADGFPRKGWRKMVRIASGFRAYPV
jgi:hypothetical protein